MDAAWPASTGEAIHTSTFLGHPVGCAMALANIKEIARLDLPAAAGRKGRALLAELKRIRSRKFTLQVRGAGLMAGVELLDDKNRPATDAALCVIKNLLHAGFIFLPEGEFSNVISFTPPLTITEAQLRASIAALRREIEKL
jgi:4-aminobutyrate aminotransferase-like enzyme